MIFYLECNSSKLRIRVDYLVNRSKIVILKDCLRDLLNKNYLLQRAEGYQLPTGWALDFKMCVCCCVGF